MKQSKVIERYFFFGLLFASFIFAFFILHPFWIVLILGISFAIILYPIYEWLTVRRLPPALASILTVLLFMVVLCVPVLGIGDIILSQSQEVYHYVVDNGGEKPILDKIDTEVNKILPTGMQFNAEAKASEFFSYISQNTTNIFSATLSTLFSFIIMFLVIFYFLKDGTKWKRAIIVLSPLDDKDDQRIISRLEQAVKGVVVGNLLVALIQGILLGFGMWIFGVPNYALWGIIAAMSSFLPGGTSLIALPAVIFLFATSNTPAALGLLIWWAVIAVGVVDNFLSPILVSRKTNIPPLLILLSVLGGISLLGPVGILVGPLTISLVYTLISIYRNEFREAA